VNGNLKYYRKKNGYTQKELSELLKMPLRTYQNYEEGKTKMSSRLESLLFFRLNYFLKYTQDRGVYGLSQIKYISVRIFSRYEIEKVLLFGSYARKSARENSNIDFLVYTEEPQFIIYKIKEELEEEFNKHISIYCANDYDLEGEFIKGIESYGIKLPLDKNR
jgi:predicted nucleotidyltransferase